MKKLLITVMGVALMSLVSIAQDADSTQDNTADQSSQQATDKSSSEDGAGGQETTQGNQAQSQDNSEGSSPTNQAIPVPQGEPAILDGTNAIPIDSSKRAGHHYKEADVKDKKKTKKAKDR